MQFDKSEYEFYESEGLVGVTITLSVPAWKDTTVGYKIASGTATEGSDYWVKDKDGNSAPAQGQVTFLAGQSQKTIYLKLEADGLVEEAESIEASIFPVNADVVLGAIPSATVYIVDGDQDLPTVQFEAKTFTGMENSGPFKIKVNLSKPAEVPITVTVRSFDGAARAPEDYRTVNEIVRFEKGEVEKVVLVTIIDDKLLEGDQSFTLKLSNPSKGAALGTIDAITVTIKDDESPLDPAVLKVEIRPDANQRGVTGDVVESTKGDLGQKHYVSPKKADSFVVLKGIDTEGKKFEDLYEWEGGEDGDSKDTRKVSRKDTKWTVVKVKKKGEKDVLTQMNVWVVWAPFEKATVVETFDSTTTVGTPPGGKEDSWRNAKKTDFRFIANIAPKSVIDGSATAADIPDLKGVKTQRVSGPDYLQEGANKRWDVSRRIRTKVLNPGPTTLVRSDYWAGKPFHWIAFDDKAKDFPAASITIENYPKDELEGSDDASTIDEDNNPYSKLDPDRKGGDFFPDIGQLASRDAPSSPFIRLMAGNEKETAEVRVQFEEFIRLQIGNSNAADYDYQNWYLLSDPYPWQTIIRYRRDKAGMVDNGSEQKLEDNSNW